LILKEKTARAEVKGWKNLSVPAEGGKEEKEKKFYTKRGEGRMGAKRGGFFDVVPVGREANRMGARKCVNKKLQVRRKSRPGWAANLWGRCLVTSAYDGQATGPPNCGSNELGDEFGRCIKKSHHKKGNGGKGKGAANYDKILRYEGTRSTGLRDTPS